MLKKMSIRKIMVATLSLFSLLLLYLMPSNNLDKKIILEEVEYVYTNVEQMVYLLDNNDYVARTTIKGCDCDIIDTIKDVSESLIIDGKRSNIIPDGFKSLIPKGTKILDLSLENNLLTINFSKELLDVSQSYEEKMIESIIFTLTSIDGVEKLVLKVEGEVLDKLPNSNKILPSILDKSYGINKTYDLINTNNIDSYTVYYVSEFNDESYYVPITKYVNEENNDKIKVIIDELSTSPIYEKNLMSFLNSNTTLINYNLENDRLVLNFNEYIFNDYSNNILEEVIYTISLSMMDNYNIKDISILVDNKEIYKNY